jgi:DNA (cytosine-5)-methyltransferase 1
LTVIDLFSGAGGMSCGFTREQGFRIIAAVDWEVGKPGKGKSQSGPVKIFCNQTYQANIGIPPLAADIGWLDPKEYRQRIGLRKRELDVLLACPPCTGFSQKIADNHLRDDPRNGLVAKSADFVEEFMPEFVVMENVKELARGRQKHHALYLLTKLSTLGYRISADVHNLADFGLPQSRTRWLLLARRGGGALRALRPSRAKRRTVRDAIAHLPPIDNGERHPVDPMHVCPKLTPPVLRRLRGVPKDGGSWADLLASRAELLTPGMLRETRRPGSFPDIYGRLWWDRPSVTITRECASPGNGRYGHPEQDRHLSVREMALLQGFPPDYVFLGGLAAKYNQIGDAVPPLISAEAARLVRLLREEEPLLRETS